MENNSKQFTEYKYEVYQINIEYRDEFLDEFDTQTEAENFVKEFEKTTGRYAYYTTPLHKVL